MSPISSSRVGVSISPSTRSYRNQTVGGGPLGPGWDFGYNTRLRELSNGDVEYYDGRGRRETFDRKEGDGAEVAYDAPVGRFVDLHRNPSGWTLVDAGFNKTRFDVYGRLIAIADAVKDSADTGNEMTFHYDPASRLIRITDTLDRHINVEYDDEGRIAKLIDFDDREVTYAYDDHGRLETVTSPKVQIGESKFPNGLETSYTYESPTGDLATRLTLRDNLASITDPKLQTWLELAYSDQDGDGRSEEVTTETWGGFPVGIEYGFREEGQQLPRSRIDGVACSPTSTMRPGR